MYKTKIIITNKKILFIYVIRKKRYFDCLIQLKYVYAQSMDYNILRVDEKQIQIQLGTYIMYRKN